MDNDHTYSGFFIDETLPEPDKLFPGLSSHLFEIHTPDIPKIGSSAKYLSFNGFFFILSETQQNGGC